PSSRSRRRIAPTLLAGIDLHEAQRTAASISKEQLARVRRGEVEYTAYAERKRQMEAELARRQRALEFEGHPATDVVLASGVTEDPWRNGKIGAAYGLALGAPWM